MTVESVWGTKWCLQQLIICLCYNAVESGKEKTRSGETEKRNETEEGKKKTDLIIIIRVHFISNVLWA